MKINNINSNQTSINNKARLNIISTDKVISSEKLVRLEEKAKKIGTSRDMILIGISEYKEKSSMSKIPFLGKFFKKEQECTEITGACHTFFDLEKPKSFIEHMNLFKGNKKQRKEQCYQAVDKYLSQIEKGVAGCNK